MAALQPSILITDDDLQFRETLGGLLQPCGFRTILAGDGEQALRIIRSDTVHLLLLDVHMPKLTGIETFRLARQTQAELPCILMTARLDDVIRKEAEQARVFSILSKPVSRREITTAVQRALRQTYGWG